MVFLYGIENLSRKLTQTPKNQLNMQIKLKLWKNFYFQILKLINFCWNILEVNDIYWKLLYLLLKFNQNFSQQVGHIHWIFNRLKLYNVFHNIHIVVCILRFFERHTGWEQFAIYANFVGIYASVTSHFVITTLCILFKPYTTKWSFSHA